MYTIPSSLLQGIDCRMAQQPNVIIAIDGACASGKTTLASALQLHYKCSVIQMDDFFLRPDQRTPQRLSQPGGNVDYERFFKEVLLPLKAGLSFSYRPFDCQTGTLSAPVQFQPAPLTVIEGSYSHHPYFGSPYDLKVFLTVSPALQHERILKRPSFLHQRFFQEWIPMERDYFSHFSISSDADIVL